GGNGRTAFRVYRQHRSAADGALVPDVQTDQAHVLFRKHGDRVRQALKELLLLERQITVAELTLHSRSERPRILHHDLLRFGFCHRFGEGKCQFGANLEPVHRTGARHALQGFYVTLLEQTPGCHASLKNGPEEYWLRAV